MKGIITAGGKGTRLYPLTYVTNKHLLPVYNKPMIFYPIETLVKAGIDEILIVVGGPHTGHFLSVLRNGRDLGVKHLEFAYQETEGGIADALSLGRDFADNGSVAVILGDNTMDADISEAVTNFTSGATIFIKEVSDPQRFGVVSFAKNNPNNVVKITEKPKKPDSSFAVTGLYLYDTQVFDFIQGVSVSDRGEMEITDVNNEYIKRGQLKAEKLTGYWRDAGTFETLLEANIHWARKAKNGGSGRQI